MKQIRIGTTSQFTTSLGFGCAHLIGAVPKRQSRRLLEQAFECGIRHFDVAPMYGFSEAETCLGAFLQTHRAQVTVTTKFGIPPGPRRRVSRALRKIGAPLLRQFRTRSPVTSSGQATNRQDTCFDVVKAEQSLINSLKRLKVDHIHVFLLHEPTAADLQDDRLLRFLETSVASGKIGTFGVGSDRAKIPELVEARSEYCSVTQYQYVFAEPLINASRSFQILHGIFGNTARKVFDQLRGDAALCDRWSRQTDLDLANENTFSRLILRTCALANEGGIVLMATKRPDRIALNCKAAADSSLDSAVVRFRELIAQSTATEAVPLPV